MKSFKLNGPYRLISFFLIAVLLVCLVGFAANGWHEESIKPDSGEGGDIADNTDENKDGQQTPTDTPTLDDSQTPNEPEVERFYNKITGLEITKEEYDAGKLAFVMSSTSPLYGVAGADLTLEFPTEAADTRMLVYQRSSATLWKIGALAPTRDFITATANFFGGITVSLGNDDLLKYSAIDTEKINLNIKSYQGTYFRENALYVYTSTNLIENAYKMSGIEKSGYKDAPFVFSSSEIFGVSSAKTVTLPYSANSKTELYYSEDSGKYLFFKNGNLKSDMLTGENISFKNVFILFADATTYEKSNGTELVLDTIGGGTGFYISGGFRTEIRWSINTEGKLELKTLDGNILTVNRGNSYISYFKSSIATSVKFS